MTFRIVTYIYLFMLPFLIPNGLLAKDTIYKIEGEILFSGEGKIYIYLVNEKVFKIPLTGLKTIILEPTKKDIAKKKMAFKFSNIKDGIYGIRCFQDQNGDGKLNRGMFGPSEPWGMSWKDEKVTRWPRFDKIAFRVTSDIKHLKIKLE